MNIFSLAIGLLMIGGTLFCLVALLTSLVTGRWRQTLTIWGFFGSLMALYVLMIWLGDQYERSSVHRDDLVGTYRITKAAENKLSEAGYEDFTGTLTLLQDGTCVGRRLPACCVHGDDERHSKFRGGYVSFGGEWALERTPNLFEVRLEMRGLKVEGGPDDDMFDTIILYVMKGQPRGLAFSIFNGDFEDLVYELPANGKE